jgi:hypothetical protein
MTEATAKPLTARGHAVGSLNQGGAVWDSCTCPLPLAYDPACPVHEGRKL